VFAGEDKIIKLLPFVLKQSIATIGAIVCLITNGKNLPSMGYIGTIGAKGYSTQIAVQEAILVISSD